jgi:hypothetical protein
MATLSRDENEPKQPETTPNTHGHVPDAARHAKATEASQATSDGTNGNHNL